MHSKQSKLLDNAKKEIKIYFFLKFHIAIRFKNMLSFQNPWTDEEVDTRNVAAQTILVAVKDAQDTPPMFHPIPPVVRVSDSLTMVKFIAFRLHFLRLSFEIIRKLALEISSLSSQLHLPISIYDRKSIS